MPPFFYFYFEILVYYLIMLFCIFWRTFYSAILEKMEMSDDERK